jgi:hypothetical protein
MFFSPVRERPVGWVVAVEFEGFVLLFKEGVGEVSGEGKMLADIGVIDGSGIASGEMSGYLSTV